MLTFDLGQPEIQGMERKIYKISEPEAAGCPAVNRLFPESETGAPLQRGRRVLRLRPLFRPTDEIIHPVFVHFNRPNGHKPLRLDLYDSRTSSVGF